MGEIIASGIGIIIGLAIIIKGIYDRFFRNYIPDPKKWSRVRAKITGRHYYQKRRIPTKNNPRDFDSGYEKSITYVVDGVTYEKYVDDTENGAVHIYYNLKNPHIIKTVREVKRKKREGKSTVYLILMIASGLIVMSIAVPFLVTGFARVTHTPIGNTYYV